MKIMKIILEGIINNNRLMIHIMKNNLKFNGHIDRMNLHSNNNNNNKGKTITIKVEL